jgi:hypothetical protein
MKLRYTRKYYRVGDTISFLLPVNPNDSFLGVLHSITQIWGLLELVLSDFIKAAHPYVTKYKLICIHDSTWIRPPTIEFSLLVLEIENES